ncbi:MAG: penicillin-binding protein activator LpoB [Bacteroidales bacterium]|nr:penicillin-binding protein activator LpoB [Bacteroidales bacterium]
MKNAIVFILSFIACGVYLHAQEDNRIVVGVAAFSCEGSQQYSGLVTENVVEILTNTHCFRVVDRTSIDKVQAELELQKSEAFIDSKNTVNQGIAVAAEKMITGHITKIPVYAIKNTNGTVKGYQASVAFQMKVVDVETGLSTEATSFQGKTSELMLSPESAVNNAMASLKNELEEYFRVNFPLTTHIVKIIDCKNSSATKVLLAAGTRQGVKVGDKFSVEYVELLDGHPYPSEIGVIKVIKVAGDYFCECEVPKKIGMELFSRFSANDKMECKLIVY